jgi:hypothetical protein
VQQQKTYALPKRKQTFPSFQAGIDQVKMKKPSKKQSLMSNWESL